ncbi:hypothetical protein [Blastococcus deserti]|uniref:Uncharacterized protein n=1 Tax=Blastococcus deserti TaxID=2259033 RepID=A0ABW4X511_9ACTN
MQCVAGPPASDDAGRGIAWLFVRVLVLRLTGVVMGAFRRQHNCDIKFL